MISKCITGGLLLLASIVRGDDVIAVGNNNKQLLEYDTLSGEIIAEYLGEFSGAVFSHDYSSDGKNIAAVTTGYLYVLETTAGARIYDPIEIPYGNNHPTVTISSLGVVAVTSGSGVRQYDLATGALITEFDLGSYVYTLNDICYSPDGKQFATVETDGTTVSKYGNIRFFDATTGVQTMLIEKVCVDGLRSIGCSPDGAFVAAAPASSIDVSVHLYNATSGALVRQLTDLTGLNGDMRCTAFSADSQNVISGGASRELRQYDVATGTLVTETLSTGGAWIQGCSYSHSSNTIAFTEDTEHAVRLIDASTGRTTGTIADPTSSTQYQVKFKPSAPFVSLG